MIKIRQLKKSRLKEAVDLINKVFPDEEVEPPSRELPASLGPWRYKKYLLETKQSGIKYWLAIDDFGRVVGVIGLFSYEEDKDEALWIGWFCVNPDCRGSGLGRRLLQFVIDKAKQAKKSFLRLYTSTDQNEFVARKLYEKSGFKLTRREPDADIEKLYYELKL